MRALAAGAATACLAIATLVPADATADDAAASRPPDFPELYTALGDLLLQARNVGPADDSADRLAQIRGRVADTYDSLIDLASRESDGWVAGLEADREAHLRAIDELSAGATALNVILAVLLDGADEVDPSSVGDPPTQVTDAITDVHGPDAGENAIDMLVGRVAVTHPGSASLVNSAFPGRYQLGAGLPVGAIPATAADAALEAVRRPVRFVVVGSEAVTVRVATYVPVIDAVGAAASSASTVVFPESGSSAVLELPVGTYTFCYEWEVPGDADGDGRVDAAHRTTGEIALTSAASTDVSSATRVTLRPQSGTSPNGRCGDPTTVGSEAAVATDADPAGGATTAAELANEGLHTFDLSCVWDDGTSGENVQVTISLEFGADSLAVAGPSAAEFFGTDRLTLARTGPDNFAVATADYAASVALSEGGASIVVDYGEFWGVLTCSLRRVS